jgi:hypothetical protein
MFDHLITGTSGTRIATPTDTEIAPWMLRLKAAYDAGYYRTEAAEGQQMSFPWQNKTCKDCPFWSRNVCQIYAESRGTMAHTCVYFDVVNRELGQDLLRERTERAR